MRTDAVACRSTLGMTLAAACARPKSTLQFFLVCVPGHETFRQSSWSPCFRAVWKAPGCLDVKYAVSGWGILCLQQSYRDVAHGHSGRCLANKSSMVCMAMYHKVSAMSVYHLSQSRAAEEGEDFPGFTVRRFGE